MSNHNRSNRVIPPAHRLALMLGASLVLFPWAINAQEVLFQESFETDGEGTRYVTEGSDVYEVPRIRSEIGNQDQAGPIYWARKSKVSIVGVPGPTPARRAIMYWHHSIDSSLVTPDFLALFESTVKWLVNNKAGATVMLSPAPNGPGDEVLRDHLIAKGYKIIEDDGADLPKTPNFDVVLKSSNGNTGNPSRFAQYPAPLLSYNGPDHDDELVSTIGATQADLDLGNITIAAAGHAAAGGKTGSFKAVTGPSSFDSIGSDIPVGAVTLATFERASAADPNVKEKVPFIVLVESGANGGSFYGGGPFGGQDGADFFAGSGLNKFATDVAVKTLTFTKPINTAGKPKLKLTIAFAATYLDFETSDYLKVFIDPDGDGPLEIDANAPLIHFTAPSGNDKYFNDVTTNPKNPTKLGLKFQDVTYDIPGNPSKIGIRIDALTTWWNEVVAFDNIRVTSGDIVAPPAGPATYRIGLNFGANEANGNLASATDAAGVLAVKQGNWNALRGQNGTNTTVVAETGGKSENTSVRVQWTSNGTWATTGRGEENIRFPAGPDKTLMTGYLDTGNATTTSVTITGIPSQLTSGGYDVYVYALGGVSGRGGGYRILDAATRSVIKDYVRAQSGLNPTNYVQVPVPPTTGTHGVGNYILFSGLNASGIVIEATTAGGLALGATPRAPVNAIQLVAPASSAPPVKVAAERTATGIKVTFSGTLQSADAVTGPWTDVAGAKSPADIAFSGARKFYRSKQ